ncbi:hypothetical protein ACJ67_01315 [Methylophilus sp. TWE2]|nr:hypothetical protein ACJ67_01315 [Methylophilus sp. TWE2]
MSFETYLNESLELPKDINVNKCGFTDKLQMTCIYNQTLTNSCNSKSCKYHQKFMHKLQTDFSASN